MACLASGSSGQKLTKKILLERNEKLNSVSERLLEELENVQKEIDKLDKEAVVKKVRVSISCENSTKPLCSVRDDLIKIIPNFWFKACENHPEISSLIDKETGERFSFLNRLEVQCLQNSSIKFSFKLNFYFDDNPFFENEVLSKEVVVRDDDCFSCNGSTIIWKPGMKILGKTQKLPLARKRKFESGSFFDWFEASPKNDSFADYFRELYQQPLRYFRKSDEDDSDSYYEDEGETDFTEDDEEETDE